MRKDSCVLFTNRALAKINLGLLNEVEEDCDRALRLNDRSLNAVLYKAEALHGLCDVQRAQELLETALETHPDQEKRIQGIHKDLHVYVFRHMGAHWGRGRAPFPEKYENPQKNSFSLSFDVRILEKKTKLQFCIIYIDILIVSLSP